jgi:hypothetical protein
MPVSFATLSPAWSDTIVGNCAAIACINAQAFGRPPFGAIIVAVVWLCA